MSSATSMVSLREEADIHLSVEGIDLPLANVPQPDCDQAVISLDTQDHPSHEAPMANYSSNLVVDDRWLPLIDMAATSDPDDGDELSLAEIRRLLQTALDTIDRHKIRKSRKRARSPGDDT